MSLELQESDVDLVSFSSREASPIWEVIPGVDSASWSSGMDVAMRRDAYLRRALALADAVGCLLAYLFAVEVAGSARARLSALAIVPAVIVVSKAIGLYDRDQHRIRKSTIDEIPSICNLAILFALLAWLSESVVIRGSFDRLQVFVLGLAAFVLITTLRTAARRVTLHVTPAERVLVVGSRGDCDRATKVLIDDGGGVSAAVVGAVVVPSAGRHVPADMPALRSAIADAIRAESVERVVLAPDGFDQEDVLELIRLIKALGIRLSVVPRLLEVVGSASAFDELQGLSLLGIRPYGLSKSSSLLKRSMDLALCAPVLLVLSPLFILIAVAVRIDSAGPIFFRQRRIGRRGEHIEILKFRSMVPHAEQLKDQLRDRNEAQGGLFKIADDPRITRVGRILRATSLDELPQLLNVLRGHMSLVGPRPLVPDEDALIEGWQRRRLAVKPGMTGLWQIFGSSRIPMPEMVKIDYLYGANWSLWLDLKILLRTIPHVVNRRGV